MNKSFENRFGMVYTNENGSKLSSRQKMRFAMRRFRALGLNEEEPCATDVQMGNNYNAINNMLNKLEAAIKKARKFIEDKYGLWQGEIPEIQDLIIRLETAKAFMVPDQEMRFARLKEEAKELPNFAKEVHKKAFGIK